MPLTPPRTLSPSKVSTFTDCALAFRFSAIDRVPEPPSMPATKGTLVHLALEKLFGLAPAQRTREAATGCLAAASAEIRTDPDFTGLALAPDAEAEFFADAAVLLDNYFALEDPTTISPIGLELMLEVPIAGVALRGIIDRLELDADGELVVTDYKTGRAPRANQEQHRLDGVRFYAFLCEQLFGKRPARVQLLYLRDPVAIISVPTEQSLRGLRIKVGAIWQAVEKACATDNFQPHPSALCNWCGFKPYCPAHGGDPSSAPRAEVPVSVGVGAAPA